MSRVTAILEREILEILPPSIFFMVVFCVVVLTRDLIGETAEIEMSSYVAATVAALVVGKSVLIADALPLFRRFSGKPMLVNVAWRTLLYLLVVALFQVLEQLIPQIRQHADLSAALAAFAAETDWLEFFATHLLFVVFLVCYCLGTAMIDVIGKDRFLEIFIGWGRPSALEPPAGP